MAAFGPVGGAFEKQKALRSRDVSGVMPNFRPTLTKQRQKKIAIERQKRICLPTDRSRGGVLMQTRTGGRLATPTQKRMRRERVAQFGNTRMIPSEILDPQNTQTYENITDPAAGTLTSVQVQRREKFRKLADQVRERLKRVESQPGGKDSPQAKQLREQLAMLEKKTTIYEFSKQCFIL